MLEDGRVLPPGVYGRFLFRASASMLNPIINPVILLSPVENGYVAYDPVADRIHHLNPIAALLAELCDGSRTIGKRGTNSANSPNASDAAMKRAPHTRDISTPTPRTRKSNICLWR